MALFHFSGSNIHHPAPLRLSIWKPNKPTSQTPLPRDTIIDFGKYKGRMLGSLPSKYLQWVSRNLRARDFERWARLADAVLGDPVYRDRIEWETAEHVLGAGDGLPKASATRSESAVEELMEISERLGWDYGDEDGWASVNFGLLGTSLGGRIPRVGKSLDGDDGLGSGTMGCSRSDWESKISEKDGVLGGDSIGSAKKGLIGDMGSSGMVWRSKNSRQDGVLGRDSNISRKGFNGLSIGEMGSSGMGWRSKIVQKDGILGGDSKNQKRAEIGSSGHRANGFKTGEKYSSGMVWRSKLSEKSGTLGEDLSSVSNMVPSKKGLEVRKERKAGLLSRGQRYYIGEEQAAIGEEEQEMVVRGRREERRERRRLQREQQLEMLRREVGVGEVGGAGSSGAFEKKGSSSNGGEVFSPFPGRGSLLDKINQRRGRGS